jgi:NADH-quinone oxidoreductase subunit L
MFRLYFNIFWGKEKNSHSEHTPHESPLIMTVPLLILALLSCVTGFIPFSKFVSSDNLGFGMHIDMTVALSGIAVAVVGIGIATALYMRGSNRPERIAQALGGLYRATLHKFYMDELWQFITKSVIFKCICAPIAWFDRHVIDATMNGLATVTHKTSASIKGLQSGQVQFYTWIFLIGALIAGIVALCV